MNKTVHSRPIFCIFPRDRRDIARLTVNGGHLDFQMYRGGGRRGL